MQQTAPNGVAAPLPSTQFARALEIVQTAGEVLAVISGRADKGQALGLQLLELIRQNGGRLTPEMDKRLSNYLVNAASAYKEIETARQPITQMLDSMAAQFIAPGKKLSAAEKGSAPFLIQQARNEYARHLQAEVKATAAAAQREAAKKAEAGRLAAEIRAAIVRTLNWTMAARIGEARKWFSELAPEALERAARDLAIAPPDTTAADMRAAAVFTLPASAYFTPAEVLEIRQQVEAAFNFDDAAFAYNERMDEVRRELLDAVPAKREELAAEAQLKETGKLNELAALAEKKRLREAEERLRQEEKQRQEEERSRQAAAAETAGAALQAQFDAAHAVAAAPVPAASTAIKIKVVHPAGWALLLNFWMEREAAHLGGLDADGADELSKKTFNTLRTYAETAARRKKDPERIESPFLQYYEEVKAKNKAV